MPRLISDIEENKLIVKNFFMNEDGSPKKEELGDFLSAVFDAKETVEILLGTTNGKYKVVEVVRDNAVYLAAWKAFKPITDWQYFLASLKINGVADRNIALIRQMIEAEFTLLLGEANDWAEADTNKLVVDNVKSFVAKYTRDGIVLEIELKES